MPGVREGEAVHGTHVDASVVPRVRLPLRARAGLLHRLDLLQLRRDGVDRDCRLLRARDALRPHIHPASPHLAHVLRALPALVSQVREVALDGVRPELLAARREGLRGAGRVVTPRARPGSRSADQPRLFSAYRWAPGPPPDSFTTPRPLAARCSRTL